MIVIGISSLGDRVSIVIACRNQGEFLGEAIESAIHQTHPCNVVVVLNDCSDNSEEVANKYLNYNNYHLIIEEEAGLSRARNIGIRHVDADYIVCLDSDDYLDLDAIRLMLEAYDGGLVRHDIKMFGDLNKMVTYGNGDDTLEQFIKFNRSVCTTMFSKSLFEEVGGYDEEMKRGFEDWDLWVRMMATGIHIKTVHKPLLFYRRHGPSMSLHAWRSRHETIEYMHDKWRKLGIKV
jgi:glycosyltransferase involved in cell wall biosynthesis